MPDTNKTNRLVSNALIFNEKDELMVVKRAEKSGNGLLGVPGGKVEPGETPAEALIREVREETGLDVISYAFFDRVNFEAIGMDVTVYIADTTGSIKLNPRECESYDFISVDLLDIEKFYNPEPALVKALFEKISFYLKCKNELKNLTRKKNIFFTDRGNTSIRLALMLAKNMGKTKVIIQDQGGWLTYEQYPEKLGFELIRMKTDHGLILFDVLKRLIDKDYVLLMNSMPGYITLQNDLDEIQDICTKKGALLINDVSGSIGEDVAKYGSIILGSFGRWKPVNIEYGGFIAFDSNEHKKFVSENFDKEVIPFYKDLYGKLLELDNRREFFTKTNAKIKADLNEMDIIHKESPGINVIIRYSEDLEKERLINYCTKNNYEHTECPRYIRVLDNAISIEVKRI